MASENVAEQAQNSPLVAALARIGRSFVAPIRDAYNKQIYPLGYAPGLDGLRGVMTIAVLLAHIRLPLAPGAVLFMDSFFVMSGYFITGLLLRDWEREGRIRFGHFYARRFARILPPLIAMLSGYVAFGYFFLPDFRAVAVDAGIVFAYLSNWTRAGFIRVDALVDALGPISYLGHTWSLAIEEQFYILWPAILFILLRRLDVGWRLFWMIVSSALGIWAWRIWLTLQGTHWFRLYNGLDTRADALLVGCALAVWLRLIRIDRRPEIERRLATLAWPILVVFCVSWVFFPRPDNLFYYYAGSMVLGCGMGVLFVLILVRPTRTILHIVFELPAFVFLGRIFYALYLWHYPIFTILQWHYRLRAGWRALIGLPVTFALAVLSYVLIERHFMRTAKKPVASAASPAARVPAFSRYSQLGGGRIEEPRQTTPP